MQNKNNFIYTGLEELKTLEYMKNYNGSIVDDSIKYCRDINSIVDFGAGIGTMSILFRKKINLNPLCIEIDENNIQELKKRKLEFTKSLLKISEPVDLVFSSNVLEHIKDDYEVLKVIKEKLKNNGMLFLYLPANMILWTKLDEMVGHYRRYEIKKIKSLCKKAGFNIVKIHYADFLGFFTTLIWKIFNIFMKKSLPSKSSLIFYDKYIFPLSRLMDKVGFRFLLGKNIIVVAKK